MKETFTITRQITVTADKLPMSQEYYEKLIDLAIEQVLRFPETVNYSWENRTIEPEPHVSDIHVGNITQTI